MADEDEGVKLPPGAYRVRDYHGRLLGVLLVEREPDKNPYSTRVLWRWAGEARRHQGVPKMRLTYEPMDRWRP